MNLHDDFTPDELEIVDRDARAQRETLVEDAVERAFREAYGDELLAPWQAEDR